MLTTRTWRRITIWLHVLTSVGWMALAASLAVLLALAAADPVARAPALVAAHHLDGVLLAPLATGSALTGIVLGAATPYGVFHHWWTTVKFASTLTLLYLGIVVLSASLDAAHDDPAAVPPAGLLTATLLMVTAIGFQAWVSIDKPWGRTPWSAGRPKPVTGPRWMFVVGCTAVVTDLVVGLVIGNPAPVLSVLALVAVLTGRMWTGRMGNGRRAPVGRA
ncbi:MULTISPECIES: hypothetical protein [Pseudonocardia]|uniref:Uncharacterized protein n=2 Tax=Pseudonocardia TaxID=1847 RepID=A0A1Y2N4Z2_PSEAH|nr:MULTISPECIES: hypothetical protein [Pseudonocardia]OSY42209.1 hypothetical protein BG845_01708 [Pseudonocardia autotrophica]TDN75025.1 hypothetical protein C8E95_4163 [Pseudonocardia autotrophica]BBF98967.1 hypothetical protein Pdca_01770 [Pseudonocardia autotrophica]GEC23887.1 hypothetical protein PSA01_09160 [Pseudonocardia saturnea]